MSEGFANCFLCGKPIERSRKRYKGKDWHKACLRKLRRKAKAKYFGSLDSAMKEMSR